MWYINKKKWVVAGASVTGKSHIQSAMVCQDHHWVENLPDHWGIAVCCDGAGSAKHSDMGSAFIAQNAALIFKELVVTEKWHRFNHLPTDEAWQRLAKNKLLVLREKLEIFAAQQQLEFRDLACTVMVIIYTPIGLLVTHIGDGRAGYLSKTNRWLPILQPHKGEEANETIFITTPAWATGAPLQMNGVEVPESLVVRDVPLAFTAMTDGCEKHAFTCSMIDGTTGKWSDPNLPYPPFLDPLVQTLQALNRKNKNAAIPCLWQQFVEGGTTGLKNEPDDKTMLLGVLL